MFNAHIDILSPLLLMICLTALVWLYMYVARLTFIVKNNILAQDLHSPEALRNVLPAKVNQSANNLSNLFELPILFYLICMIAIVTSINSDWLLNFAWSFVVLRAFHSLIHCWYNNVTHRFIAYLISTICLWAMLIIILWQVP